MFIKLNHVQIKKKVYFYGCDIWCIKNYIMSTIILIILWDYWHFSDIYPNISGFQNRIPTSKRFGKLELRKRRWPFGWRKVKVQMALKLPYKFYCTVERMFNDYTNLTVVIINWVFQIFGFHEIYIWTRFLIYLDFNFLILNELNHIFS